MEKIAYVAPKRTPGGDGSGNGAAAAAGPTLLARGAGSSGLASSASSSADAAGGSSAGGGGRGEAEGGVSIIRNFTYNFLPGERLGIVGRNGTGG